jgi:hypothetical protein
VRGAAEKPSSFQPGLELKNFLTAGEYCEGLLQNRCTREVASAEGRKIGCGPARIIFHPMQNPHMNAFPSSLSSHRKITRRTIDIESRKSNQRKLC